MRKHTLLRVILFLFFVAMAGLVLYELDLHYYQAEKLEYIADNHSLYLTLPAYSSGLTSEKGRELAQALASISDARNELQRETRTAHVREYLEKIVKGPSPFHAIELTDESGKVVVQASHPDKLRERGRFPDALFLGGFSKFTRMRLTNRDRVIGEARAYYTTPKNDPTLQRIAWRYLWIALLLGPFVFAPFIVIDRVFLLPYGQVLEALEKTGREAPRLLRPAQSDLAARYNDLARDALLQEIERQFREPGRRFQEESDIPGALPQMAASLLGYPWFLAVIARRAPAAETSSEQSAEAEVSASVAEKSSWELIAATLAGHPIQGLSPKEIEKLAGDWARRLLDSDGADDLLEAARTVSESGGERSFVWRWPGDEAEPRTCLAAILNPGGSARRVFLLAGAPAEDAPGAIANEAREIDLFDRLLAKIDSLLDAFALQRRLLARERGEANVSLARNLGHDLTNIIATSKLDMMALGKLAERFTQGRPPSADEAEIMRETLDSLRSNARYMQEIVNIYRSFSYMKRPTYEMLDVRELLDQIIDVFQLSTGMRVDIERRYPATLAPLEVEPRLLKLALFNILNNALDALKRESGRRGALAENDAISSAEPWRPRISVVAEAREDGGAVLAIEDNGPGLRDESGRLLPPEETSRIFALGYTTKKAAGEEGEGLGLNWVWIIARDFHGGRVRAENIPAGGARFLIELPAQARRYRKEL
jgi:signal transduction histidine kinase